MAWPPVGQGLRKSPSLSAERPLGAFIGMELPGCLCAWPLPSSTGCLAHTLGCDKVLLGSEVTAPVA